jgi:hypothetical protein
MGAILSLVEVMSPTYFDIRKNCCFSLTMQSISERGSTGIRLNIYAAFAANISVNIVWKSSAVKL